MRSSVLTCLVLLVGVSSVGAADLLPPERTLESAIDHYIDAQLQKVNVEGAAPADDATYLRRVTLDLAGRLPTALEVKQYLASSDPNKKQLLVERLLGSPSYVRHQTFEFDAMLSANRPGELRDYLTAALTENRSWDRIFRELLVPTDDQPKQKGASSFLRQRVSDLDRLTNDVSVLFFGVNVSCAQCHDHPKVEDWKQDHFYGMKSFFARTFDNGGFLAERGFGGIKFKPNKGAEKQAQMMFLTGKKVEHASLKDPPADEAKRERDKLEEFKKSKKQPPPPAWSARSQLVELALQPGERDWFARAAVNRLWQRYFGLGLVNPVDQMHAENPPSHPDLLAWLARDFIANNYDLKRLTRGLVLSNAYARSSRWEGENSPKPNLFAVARVRPLTPTQLGAALRFATTDPESWTKDASDKRLEQVERSGHGMANLFEQPKDDFQISVTEALLFSNGDRIQKELLGEGGDQLLGRLKLLKTNEERIEIAVNNVFCRPPRPEEVAALKTFLDRRADRPLEATRHLVWALLTSAEFRFNH